jgi:hypothetical protein
LILLVIVESQSVPFVVVLLVIVLSAAGCEFVVVCAGIVQAASARAAVAAKAKLQERTVIGFPFLSVEFWWCG